MKTALLVGSAASGLAAIVWARLGLALLRRDLPAQHREAGWAFSAAWFAGATFAGVNAAVAALSAFGSVTPALALAAAWTSVICGVGLVGCFVAHMLHLATGSPRAVRWTLAAHAVELTLVLAVIAALGPTGAETNGWTLRFSFARAPAFANSLIALVVLLPAFVSSVAYLLLLRYATTPTARWRIGLVGGGTAAWILTAAIPRLLNADLPWLAAGRLLGAAAAILVLVAYWPPAFARERWGIRSIQAEFGRRQPSAEAIAEQRERLAMRVRELI